MKEEDDLHVFGASATVVRRATTRNLEFGCVWFDLFDVRLLVVLDLG